MDQEPEKRGSSRPPVPWWAEFFLLVLIVSILALFGSCLLTLLRIITDVFPPLRGLFGISGHLGMGASYQVDHALAATGLSAAHIPAGETSCEQAYQFGFTTGCIYTGVIALVLSGFLVLILYLVSQARGRRR